MQEAYVNIGYTQKTHGVAGEQAQDADMEQVAGPSHAAPAQQLTRPALPGVLLALEADEAAEQEDRERDIGKDAEQHLIEIAHRRHLRSGSGA